MILEKNNVVAIELKIRDNLGSDLTFIFLQTSNSKIGLTKIFLFQVSKDLSEEYERLVNPEKALEDSKPPRIKEEPMSDISFPVSEEPEADLASGDQALPMGVLGAHGERLAAGLDGDHSPHPSGEIRVLVRMCSLHSSLYLYCALM